METDLSSRETRGEYVFKNYSARKHWVLTPVLKGVGPRKVGRKVHPGEATNLAVHHSCSRAIVRLAMGLQHHSLASLLSSLSCLIFTLGEYQHFADMFLCA